MSSGPKVSIGLPVYNGENYLGEALDSLLQQTFEDYELIISDNASNDRTGDIARDYAARDSRVRYICLAENRGASANFTRVFEESSGKYFKWAAHDDVCAPEYLSRCVEILDSDSSVSLAHTVFAPLYAEGKVGDPWPVFAELESSNPAERFAKVLRIGPEISFIWGVIRKEMLARTSLLGNYVGQDRTLLSALSLMGKFRLFPELLFFQREHPSRAVHTSNWHNTHQAVAWYDTSLSGKIVFPAWRVLMEHLNGINRASLELRVRLDSYRELYDWSRDRKQQLFCDLLLAGKRLPLLNRLELRRLDYLFNKIWLVIPRQSSFILVDEEKLETDIFSDWQVIPFLEKDGQYWGRPADDQTAINELERLRVAGADFIIFVTDTLWWLDSYKEFGRYLRLQYRTITDNRKCLIFDLRRRTVV